MIPVLQIRKLRCREMKCLAEGRPTASWEMELELDGVLSGAGPGLYPLSSVMARSAHRDPGSQNIHSLTCL